MDDETVRWVAALAAAVAPITVASVGAIRLLMSSIEKRHRMRMERLKQVHEIESHYLDRALNAETPFIIRLQYLRFLSKDQDDRLRQWAADELVRLEGEVKILNDEVDARARQLEGATNATELRSAELLYREAVRRRDSTKRAASAAMRPADIVGAWKSGSSHMYCSISNGELRGIYCFEGDSHATGEYVDWAFLEDRIFAKFRCFSSELQGESVLSPDDRDTLTGWYWYDGEITSSTDKQHATRVKWRRLAESHPWPKWAQSRLEAQTS